MWVEGSCYCGSVTFAAEVDPGQVSICHCTDCQSLTGTAFRVSVGADAKDFRILRGTPSQYIKVGESGARRLQGFCGECGTPLFATSADQPRRYGIRVGALRQRSDLVPTKQIWRQSAPRWVPHMEWLETWQFEDGD